MRALIYMRDNRGEKSLTASLTKGIEKHGDESRVVLSTDFLVSRDWQSAEIVFIGRSLPGSKIVIDAARAASIPFVYYDKGYFQRGWKTQDPEVYYRFSVNSFQPLEYFQTAPKSSDRWRKLGIPLEPLKKGTHILVAGHSDKFAAFYGIDAEKQAAEIVASLEKLTRRPVIYRPRTTSQNQERSSESPKMREMLKDAYALVTFASNAAVDAILSGVPAFVLGPGIAKPVSNTDLSKINDPWFPSEKERLQWCYDLAYCQWRVEEMEDGSLWNYLKENLAYAH